MSRTYFQPQANNSDNEGRENRLSYLPSKDQEIATLERQIEDGLEAVIEYAERLAQFPGKEEVLRDVAAMFGCPMSGPRSRPGKGARDCNSKANEREKLRLQKKIDNAAELVEKVSKELVRLEGVKNVGYLVNMLFRRLAGSRQGWVNVLWADVPVSRIDPEQKNFSKTCEAPVGGNEQIENAPDCDDERNGLDPKEFELLLLEEDLEKAMKIAVQTAEKLSEYCKYGHLPQETARKFGCSLITPEKKNIKRQLDEEGLRALEAYTEATNQICEIRNKLGQLQCEEEVNHLVNVMYRRLTLDIVQTIKDVYNMRINLEEEEKICECESTIKDLIKIAVESSELLAKFYCDHKLRKVLAELFGCQEENLINTDDINIEFDPEKHGRENLNETFHNVLELICKAGKLLAVVKSSKEVNKMLSKEYQKAKCDLISTCVPSNKMQTSEGNKRESSNKMSTYNIQTTEGGARPKLRDPPCNTNEVPSSQAAEIEGGPTSKCVPSDVYQFPKNQVSADEGGRSSRGFSPMPNQDFLTEFGPVTDFSLFNGGQTFTYPNVTQDNNDDLYNFNFPNVCTEDFQILSVEPIIKKNMEIAVESSELLFKFYRDEEPLKWVAKVSRCPEGCSQVRAECVAIKYDPEKHNDGKLRDDLREALNVLTETNYKLLETLPAHKVDDLMCRAYKEAKAQFRTQNPPKSVPTNQYQGPINEYKSEAEGPIPNECQPCFLEKQHGAPLDGFISIAGSIFYESQPNCSNNKENELKYNKTFILGYINLLKSAIAYSVESADFLAKYYNDETGYEWLDSVFTFPEITCQREEFSEKFPICIDEVLSPKGATTKENLIYKNPSCDVEKYTREKVQKCLSNTLTSALRTSKTLMNLLNVEDAKKLIMILYKDAKANKRCQSNTTPSNQVPANQNDLGPMPSNFNADMYQFGETTQYKDICIGMNQGSVSGNKSMYGSPAVDMNQPSKSGGRPSSRGSPVDLNQAAVGGGMPIPGIFPCEMNQAPLIGGRSMSRSPPVDANKALLDEGMFMTGSFPCEMNQGPVTGSRPMYKRHPFDTNQAPKGGGRPTSRGPPVNLNQAPLGGGMPIPGIFPCEMNQAPLTGARPMSRGPLIDTNQAPADGGMLMSGSFPCEMNQAPVTGSKSMYKRLPVDMNQASAGPAPVIGVRPVSGVGTFTANQGPTTGVPHDRRPILAPAMEVPNCDENNFEYAPEPSAARKNISNAVKTLVESADLLYKFHGEEGPKKWVADMLGFSESNIEDQAMSRAINSGGMGIKFDPEKHCREKLRNDLCNATQIIADISEQLIQLITPEQICNLFREEYKKAKLEIRNQSSAYEPINQNQMETDRKSGVEWVPFNSNQIPIRGDRPMTRDAPYNRTQAHVDGRKPMYGKLPFDVNQAPVIENKPLYGGFPFGVNQTPMAGKKIIQHSTPPLEAVIASKENRPVYYASEFEGQQFEAADLLPQEATDSNVVQKSLKELTSVTPCVNVENTGRTVDDLLAACDLRAREKTVKRQWPTKPNLSPDAIDKLLECEYEDIVRTKTVQAETKAAFKKPCQKQEKAQTTVKQIVRSHNQLKEPICEKDYPPMVHPDPEDISPELAAAMVFSQERGIKMDGCPDETIKYLFPDTKDASSKNNTPAPDPNQQNDNMIRKSASVPSEGVSDSAYSKGRQKSDGGSRASYDCDAALGLENCEYVLVAPKPQRINRTQFRGCVPKLFPGFLSAFPDEVNLPKVVSSPSRLFEKAWAATCPKTFPLGDIIVVE